MEEYEVRVETRNASGEKLVGILARKAPESNHVVILCHGLLCHKNRGIILSLAKALPFNTFRGDFSGNGESEGACVYAHYHKEAEDLRAFVECLRGEHRLDVQGILGHSKGGNVVLLYSAKYGDVPFVVNLCGRYEMTRSPPRFSAEQMAALEAAGSFHWEPSPGARVLVDKAAIRERETLDMAAAARAVSARVLIVHGTADNTVPVEDAASYAALLESHELELVEGAGHSFVGHEARVADAVARFFRAAGIHAPYTGLQAPGPRPS
eukprot:tig00021350_g20628.t1